MGNDFVIFGITFFSAFVITFVFAPFLIKKMVLRKIVGTDMNKFHKPKVAELGGISVLFGLIFGIMMALGFDSFFGDSLINLTPLLAAFSTIIIVGLLGILDDIIGWKRGIAKWQHALVPVFAALPLMVLPQSIAVTELTFPFLGGVSFGILYPLIIVPLAITGASNAVNILAGFNGLETGMGIIISFTVLLVAFFLPLDHPGRIEVIVLMSGMLGALIAFLKFNWFPAKIFGGDSLTLMIGASIAASSIIGNIERIGFMLFLIYFVELVFKAKHRFRTECFGLPQKNGFLLADPRGGSITHFIMKRGKFTEKQVVLIILGVQSLISCTVFLLFWFKLFNLIS